MPMPADRTGAVIGVDTHRGTHHAGIARPSGAVIAACTIRSTSAGYAQLLAWISGHAPGPRLAACIEGTRSYGAGLARAAAAAGLLVIECEQPARKARRGKGTPGPAGAHLAVRAGLARRRQPRDASRAQAVRHGEIRRLTLALPEAARALKASRAELNAIAGELAPGLAGQPGTGPVSAAQAIVSFSHPRRCRSDAAFARLAGTSPIEASSGRTIRHRPNRGGDRAPNRAIHIIASSRMRSGPAPQAHAARRRAEGKPDRETRRCLKRYIARQLYRAPTTAMTPASAWPKPGDTNHRNDLTTIEASPGTASPAPVRGSTRRTAGTPSARTRRTPAAPAAGCSPRSPRTRSRPAPADRRICAGRRLAGVPASAARPFGQLPQLIGNQTLHHRHGGILPVTPNETRSNWS